MMKVYADTSTIGGCFDEEFHEWSVALIDEFKVGKKIIMLSDLTLQVIQLAETYILEGALTIKSYNDALHIALATLNNTDVLASWNFKHIVNLNRIRLYNSINLKLGYRMVEIRTPREILELSENEQE